MKITMDGVELAGDATTVSMNAEKQYKLNNELFGEDIAVAGFDLYAIDSDMTTAAQWSLAKGAKKDSAVASYMTNNISAIGHGLVGAYGVEGSGVRDAEAGADVLDDAVMSYDPETRVLTVKDPGVTHVVVQYAVGKFGDSSGGVCGVSYDLADLYADVMYRMYNDWSGEHFYTSSAAERDNLMLAGWNYEGVAWTAPKASEKPVYRLYNSDEPLGDHHYTMSAEERDMLIDKGWTYEGIGWYSDENEGSELLRLYNPNAYELGMSGGHHYTAEADEAKFLDSVGWTLEGGAWFGVAARAQK